MAIASNITRVRQQIAPLFWCVFCLVALAGCSDGNDNESNNHNIGPTLLSCADDNSCASNPPLTLSTTRPAQVQIPVDYSTATRYPLVVVLHGFGANGLVQAVYLGLTDRVDAQQYVLVYPDGTLNNSGARYWNATDACCAFTDEQREVDDVAYIRALIEEAAATYSIDTSRVGLMGHSNGGFMALRMACEASDIVTSVVSLAGSTFADAETCQPATNPVSVLLMHGDDDATIPYSGSEGLFPSAPETLDRFAVLAGCDTQNPITKPSLDVMTAVAGVDTEVVAYEDCLRGTNTELWTLVGGPHIPAPWESGAQDLYLDWMLSHAR